MNFEVNNTTYFLTYDGDDGEWLLLTPEKNGFRRLELYDDDAESTTITIPDIEPADHQPVN